MDDLPFKNESFDIINSVYLFHEVPSAIRSKILTEISRVLKKNGVFICGMPSLESQKYASKISKAGHVNCKKGIELKKTLDKYFNHTFVFSMNDEVVHTGFFPMAHYLIGIGCGVKVK